jgi:hypothetical protein
MISLDCRRTSMILREDSPPKREPADSLIRPASAFAAPTRIRWSYLIPHLQEHLLTSVSLSLPVMGPRLCVALLRLVRSTSEADQDRIHLS